MSGVDKIITTDIEDGPADEMESISLLIQAIKDTEKHRLKLVSSLDEQNSDILTKIGKLLQLAYEDVS